MSNILYNPHAIAMLASTWDSRRIGVDTNQGSLQ